jgi:hypothetical protein
MKEKIQKFVLLFDELTIVYNSRANWKTKYNLIFCNDGYRDKMIVYYNFNYDTGLNHEDYEDYSRSFYHKAGEIYEDFLLIDFGDGEIINGPV